MISKPSLLTKQINDSPEPLRNYVYQLETDADPSWNIRRALWQEIVNTALLAKISDLQNELEKAKAVSDDEDICGFCGEPGADKMPHPVRWPGEESAGTELVHAECESNECGRAHAELSDDERNAFLERI